MDKGPGSTTLRNAIEKYLHIGYIDVEVDKDNAFIDVKFYYGLTEVDLSETHLRIFTKFLNKYDLQNYISGKERVNRYSFCYRLRLFDISAEELSGLLRLDGGVNGTSSSVFK